MRAVHPLHAIACITLVIGCADARSESVRLPHDVAPALVPAGEGGAPFSLDSALVLFRADLPEPLALSDGAESIDALVERFARAVANSDTTELRRLMMSRSEFAYLYYPTSPHMREPTKQEPNLVWFLHLQASQKGATRLLNRYAGRPLPLVVENSCVTPPRREGENVLWDDCMQRVVTGSDTATTRLFAGIYERSGQFKIFSYANDM